jgi:hypothetical protein
MKKILSVLVMTLLSTSVFRISLHADQSCGDDGTTCAAEEHCCEHVIAMFSEDHAVAPPYIQGQCAPKNQKCVEFWCGNRHCKAGFFGSPSVCCVNTPEQGSTPQYSCAGNSEQLTIRSSSPTRTLQRG